jgi:hypothetical protein
LQPAGAGYRAQLAAGADGCDPELRVLDVPDVPSALGALPEVLAAAEARWQAAPRYQLAPRAPAAARPRSETRAAAAAAHRTERTTTPPPPRQVAAATPAAPLPGQLPLFG